MPFISCDFICTMSTNNGMDILVTPVDAEYTITGALVLYLKYNIFDMYLVQAPTIRF